MRLSHSLIHAGLALSLSILTACSTSGPNANDADEGAGSSGGTSGFGSFTGAGGNDGGDGDGDLVIGTGGSRNPCAGEDAPEECEVQVAPACGDGEINLTPPEACDDGNSVPGDGCSGACVLEPYSVCPVPGERCQSTIVCGDGAVGPGEACDDGNSQSGDGCASTCQEVEMGFRCRLEGEACVRVFVCGDGVTDESEGCDDGGISPEDGCDERCRIETGFKCEGSPSTCSPTTCGDGLQEGAESCDDGNFKPFDGCSPTCQAEPDCATGQACTSSCGDGMLLGSEQCDDGNLRSGDGCSSTCLQELGFVCNQPDECEGNDCTLDLPIIYRDFAQSHPDFEVGCGEIKRGVTKDLLSGYGKPELSSSSFPSACIQSAASFEEWYTDVPSNAELVSNIVLFDNQNGGYVNRMDNEGTRYELQASSGIQWCSNSPDDCAACPPGYSVCHAPCTPWGDTSTQTCAVYDPEGEPVYIDGNPLFFPIEESLGSSGDLDVAHIPEEVYGGGWQADPSGIERNFYFTSEIAYWFEYRAGMTAALSFVGDDDLWVFVNGRLAVDLGGLHVPVEGSFTLNADGSVDLLHGKDGTADQNVPATSSAANFGLEDGNVYEVKVFQAERKKTGSSYRLTLSGFNAGVSECVTNCGDGEVGPGEECDDGPGNLGAYNQCTPDCTLGPRCGDGVQQEQEACDYGEADNVGAYGGCAANCELGPYCGDALTSDSEECDNGENTGGYGECAPGCVLGPVCGDGGLELEFEQCDDGNNNDFDGCSAACKIEIVVVK